MKKRKNRLAAIIVCLLLLASMPALAGDPIRDDSLPKFMTTVTATALRDKPSTMGERLVTVAMSTILHCTGEYALDSRNSMWYSASYMGLKGWIPAKCVSFSKNTDDNTIETVRPTPVPTPMPTPVPTPVPTVQPTPVPTPTRGRSARSIGQYNGTYDVSASSYLHGNAYSVYGSCAMDGNLNSAWNSSRNIEGEWVQIVISDGRRYEIGGLRIAAGYWKSTDVYNNNSRPRTIDVYCDGLYADTFVLEDIRSLQTLWFEEPIEASSVMIVVRDGYKGKTDKDCCITEIDLMGPMGDVLNTDTLGDWGGTVKSLIAALNDGKSFKKGSYGYEVLGLQLLLQEGFGVLTGNVDGSFGGMTEAAVNALADLMRDTLYACEPMRDGVVDAAYWRNLTALIDYVEGE